MTFYFDLKHSDQQPNDFFKNSNIVYILIFYIFKFKSDKFNRIMKDHQQYNLYVSKR